MSFGDKSQEQQKQIIEALHISATLAGLAGEVVPVWDAGDKRMAFIAPKGYHPYFKSISLEFVTANLNSGLYA